MLRRQVTKSGLHMIKPHNNHHYQIIVNKCFLNEFGKTPLPTAFKGLMLIFFLLIIVIENTSITHESYGSVDVAVQFAYAQLFDFDHVGNTQKVPLRIVLFETPGECYYSYEYSFFQRDTKNNQTDSDNFSRVSTLCMSTVSSDKIKSIDIVLGRYTKISGKHPIRNIIQYQFYLYKYREKKNRGILISTSFLSFN